MKTLISVLFLFTLSSASLSAQEINWVSLEQAEKMVQADPSKKIFVNFYTDWCGYCRKMLRKTFSNPEVINKLNKDFINVRFNAEGEETIKFLNKTYRFLPDAGRNGVHYFAYLSMYGRLSYPTSVIMDSRGVKTKVIRGFQKSKELLSQIN